MMPKHIEAIILYDSAERSKPSLIDVKEKREYQRFRNKIEQVNQLMKQFEQMSKMMKMHKRPGGKTS
jgi:signal recognition particle subunit SRP54